MATTIQCQTSKWQMADAYQWADDKIPFLFRIKVIPAVRPQTVFVKVDFVLPIVENQSLLCDKIFIKVNIKFILPKVCLKMYPLDLTSSMSAQVSVFFPTKLYI